MNKVRANLGHARLSNGEPAAALECFEAALELREAAAGGSVSTYVFSPS